MNKLHFWSLIIYDIEYWAYIISLIQLAGAHKPVVNTTLTHSPVYAYRATLALICKHPGTFLFLLIAYLKKVMYARGPCNQCNTLFIMSEGPDDPTL